MVHHHAVAGNTWLCFWTISLHKPIWGRWVQAITINFWAQEGLKFMMKLETQQGKCQLS